MFIYCTHKIRICSLLFFHLLLVDEANTPVKLHYHDLLDEMYYLNLQSCMKHHGWTLNNVYWLPRSLFMSEKWSSQVELATLAMMQTATPASSSYIRGSKFLFHNAAMQIIFFKFSLVIYQFQVTLPWKVCTLGLTVLIYSPSSVCILPLFD